MDAGKKGVRYSISSDMESHKIKMESTTGIPHHYGLTSVDRREIVGYVADFSRRRPDEHVIFYSEGMILHIPKNAIQVLDDSDVIIKPGS